MKWVLVFWPSFVTAVLGEIAFFAFIDPQELYLLGEPVRWSPLAVYSAGFFMFWALTALTTALGLFFRRPASEVNAKLRLVPNPPADRQRGRAGRSHLRLL